jgi:MoxR-like ATPase
VSVHHPDLEKKVVDQCLKVFYELRQTSGLRKKPSTSELIDWIAALRRSGVPLRRLEREIPFLGALLKQERDVDLVAGGF